MEYFKGLTAASFKESDDGIKEKDKEKISEFLDLKLSKESQLIR